MLSLPLEMRGNLSIALPLRASTSDCDMYLKRPRPRRLRAERMEQRLLLSFTSETQYLSQDVVGIRNRVASTDRFGEVLATGDFDGDGTLDLAVGIPGKRSRGGTGAVNVIFGKGESLDSERNQLLTHRSLQGSSLVGIASFAASLAAGDFDGDLAVGIPQASVSGTPKAGKVLVVYGDRGNGLSNSRVQAWHQDVRGVFDQPNSLDHFGETLATGDFNDDGRSDLAIGVPNETIESARRAGAVQVLFGTDGQGLSAQGSQLLFQGRKHPFPVLGTAVANERFGSSLTTGDFDGDGNSDLVVGIPGEQVGEIEAAGAVAVFYGHSRNPLGQGDNQLWHQDTPGIDGGAEQGDEFGFSIAPGDFDDDDHLDLAIGIPGRTVDRIENAGAVRVIHGQQRGLVAQRSWIVHQNSEGLERAEADDRFGSVLASADLQLENEGDEIVVGVPNEDLDLPNVGVVPIIGIRKESRWSFPNAQTIRPSDVQLIENADARFGAALSLDYLSFDHPMRIADLFIGIPNHAPAGGAVTAIYGGIDLTRPEAIVFPTPGQSIPILAENQVCFDVEFSEPVTGFDLTDLVLSDMPGAFAAIYAGRKSRWGDVGDARVYYTVGVEGMSETGIVTAQLAENAVEDLYGLQNVESNESSIEYIFRLRGTVDRLEADERPNEMLFRVRFNRNVVLTADDVVVEGGTQPKSIFVTKSDVDREFLITLAGLPAAGDFPLTVWVHPDCSPRVTCGRKKVGRFHYHAPQASVAVEFEAKGPNGTYLDFSIIFSRRVSEFEASDILLAGDVAPSVS